MPLNNGEPSEGGGSNDFQEHRIRRADEEVLQPRVEDIATLDQDVDELVDRGGET
jgi:hypothetical protein